jgi:hypothetical protein
MAILAQHEEVMLFIENHSLMGKGLGYIALARFGNPHQGSSVDNRQ